MKIVNVVGARPNFVKIAALLVEMRKRPEIKPLLVHTGQHYDEEMSDNFFRDLDILQPDLNLEVGPGSHAEQTAEVMKRVEAVLVQERPSLVVVVGDVNSTLAAALTAVKLGIPVAHVESGLRSFDRTMPEEINRVVTDAVADLLFVSEPSGVENLVKEGRPSEQIFLVGNVMIDTLQRFLTIAPRSNVQAHLGLPDGKAGSAPAKYAVVTLHRPALVDNLEVWTRIWESLEEIARQIPLVFPVHPRTRKRLQEAGLNDPAASPSERHGSGIRMVPPLGYLQFLHLQSEAMLVITDSGGIQEETTALGVPCLTVRENTERPITVTEGTNTLVGLDAHRLREEAAKVLAGGGKRGRKPALWDGRCAERIVNVLCEWYGSRRERHRAEPGASALPRISPLAAP